MHRHEGFKLFCSKGTNFLCAGTRVLSYFVVKELNFCAQACGPHPAQPAQPACPKGCLHTPSTEIAKVDRFLIGFHVGF